jgi:asparagine synthase (glutamine-hydrolysing)
MCGIVGIFDITGHRNIDRNLLSRMNETQKHRGPDEGGIHTEPGLGFGHRRLSIIDLSSGKQPLFNRDATIGVTYNGEIYNFMEIRKKLENLGYEFFTHCDTEVIVYSWEAWGEECLTHFRGMFAFAIWDRMRETLFLARDRLGVKPLYYTFLNNGLFLFGSELKSLKIHPNFPLVIDTTSVEDYFAYGYIPDPKSIYRNVYKLSPGYSLSLRRGQPIPQPKQYWNVPFNIDSSIHKVNAIEELTKRLREAVDIRRVSDVPLGAFLSGGVDSSAVVAMMAGLSADPVNTFSISFGDPAFNESRYAQQVAERFGTYHRTEQVDPDDLTLIDKLVGLYDEPFADSSALPTYRVCQLARTEVTVALSGDGGDENFAGYRRYRWHNYEEQVRHSMPSCVRRPLFGFLGQVYPKLDWAPKIFRAKSTFQAIARNTLEGYFQGVSVMNNEQRDDLYSEHFKNDLQGYHAIEVFYRHAATSPTHHPLSLVQYLDMKTYLPGDILTKVDRASMAHGLEVRVPFLDNKLVEWISTLPPEFKLRGREGKYILKKALEPYLTNEILYRPKMGFAIPLSRWFRGSLKNTLREAVHNPIMADSGFFDMAFLNSMFDQHQSGVRDHAPSLWSLLVFESFLRQNM